MRKFLLILCVFGLTVAGCGGDSGGEEEQTLEWRCSPGDRQCGVVVEPPVQGDISVGRITIDVSELDGVYTPPSASFDCAVVPNELTALNTEFDPADFTGNPRPRETEIEMPSGLAIFSLDPGTDPLVVVDELLAAGIPAAPHYQFGPAPVWKYGPHGTHTPLVTEPPGAQVPLPGGYLGGTGVPKGIVVIDTGGEVGFPNVTTEHQEPSNLDSSVRGHGAFVGSVAAAAVGKSAKVRILAAFQAGSELTEEEQLIETIRGAQIQPGEIVNLSLGTYPCKDGSVPLLLAAEIAGLQGDLETFDADESVVVVAAAGNDGHTSQDERFFPASFGDPNASNHDYWLALFTLHQVAWPEIHEQVVSVGARYWDGSSWQVDDSYSNVAEVYMPGTDVVGHHPDGTVVWSGTSFAAPNFAGCLAVGLCQVP